MKTLIFGSTGSLGSAIMDTIQDDFKITRVSVSDNDPATIKYGSPDYDQLIKNEEFNAVIWAGGLNTNDSIIDLNLEKLNELLEANLLFIVKSLSNLKNSSALAENCSLVIVSSIWQDFSRNNKFSYTVSKSALAGVVKSVATDLGKLGIRINSVSPGVVLNEMSRKNLSVEQIAKFKAETPLGRLISPEEVANTVAWLISNKSSGITGQNIVVDGGWTISRYV